MKDVELVKGDDEADAMTACAVMYVREVTGVK